MEIPTDGQAQVFRKIFSRIFILRCSKRGMMSAGSVRKIERGRGVRKRGLANNNYIFRAGPFSATEAVVIQIGAKFHKKGSLFSFVH